MISLAGAVAFLLLGMPEESAGGMEQVQLAGYLSSIPMLLVALVTTAMLITALCMCFCIFAKSTKEANNYITPVMLVIMFASMIGMVPSIELNYRFRAGSAGKCFSFDKASIFTADGYYSCWYYGSGKYGIQYYCNLDSCEDV